MATQETPAFANLCFWLLRLVAGAVWWMGAHTMTLLLPLSGPWLPIPAAIPTGLLMGVIFGLSRVVSLFRRVLVPAGLTAGSYLGWVFARGDLGTGGVFAPPSEADRLAATLVCGGLGVIANGGMRWLLETYEARPVRLLGILVLLLAVLMAGVLLLALSQSGDRTSAWDVTAAPVLSSRAR